MLSRSTVRRGLAVTVSVVLVGGVLVTSAAGSDDAGRPALVAAAELARPDLPEGSTDRGRTGAEESALRLARVLGGVPADEVSVCPDERLRVSWETPVDGYAMGAHLDPVGPAPQETTTAVNGVVLCDGTRYAYLGFEARWSGSAWDVQAVPVLDGEHDAPEEHADEHPGEHEEHADEHAHDAPAPAAPRPVPAPAPAKAPVGSLGGLPVPSGGIDGYAAYDPQRYCDPVAKPGTAALRDLLLRTYPVSSSMGISRSCGVGGLSEHKEGRAFDWGVNVSRPAERAAAESFVSQLLATDAAGNPHALARRLGVMYVIWDREIWSAYSTHRGWRPYTGASPHTDHVHVSLSWDGAMGRTSFWSGENAGLLTVDPALRLEVPASSSGGSSGPSGGSSGSSGGSGGGSGDVVAAPVLAAPRPEEQREEKAAMRKAARREAERQAAEHARVLAEQAAAAAQAAEQARQEAERAAAKAAHEQQKAAEKAARAAQKAAEKAARTAPDAAVAAVAPAPAAAKPPKAARAPKAATAAQVPKAAKAPKAPKVTKAPKAAKSPKGPRAAKGGGGGKGKG